nr:unnamed protein product [Callosobruchus chinensis]
MYVVVLKVFLTFVAYSYGDEQKKMDAAVDAGGSAIQEYTVLLSLDDFKSVYCAGLYEDLFKFHSHFPEM